jgi:hypothetical protein
MQPTEPLSQDIKTLQDYLFQQFKATDPIEVQNILDKPYYFKYCVSENIETPDPLVRRVTEREYEEHTFAPGESKVLMGGAAYIFVAGVAQQYVFETQGADATASIAALVEAAKLVIIGRVGYAKSQPVAPTVNQPAHNPNVVKDDSGNMPVQTNVEQTGGKPQDEDAFASIGTNPPVSEFEFEGNFYDTTANGRYRMNKNFVKQEVFEAAREGYYAATAATA